MVDFSTKVKQMRSAGFKQEEVDSFVTSRRAALKNAGFTDIEVDDFMGIQYDKEEMNQEVDAMFQQGEGPSAFERFLRKFEPSWSDRVARSQVAVTHAEESGERPSTFEKPVGEAMSDAVEQGFQESVTGLIYRGKAPDGMTPEEAEYMPTAARILQQTTTLAGDFPFMLTGAVAGAEGGPLTAMGGAFALPAGLRKVYMDKYTKGEVSSFRDFWDRLTGAVAETSKGMITGMLTSKVGVNVPGAGKIPAEVATMVTVGAALEGRVPEPQEFLDAAILIGGIHASTRIAGRLRRLYVEKGVTPDKVLKDIQDDPVLRNELLGNREKTPDAYEGKPGEVEGIETEFKALSDETGAISIGKPTTGTTAFKFSDGVLEAEHQAAHGIKEDPFRARAFRLAEEIGKKVVREFEALPKDKEFAKARSELLKLQKQKIVSSYESIQEIAKITKGLTKEDYNIFERTVLLTDLREVAKEGKTLPGSWTKEAVAAELERLEAVATPKVLESLSRRDKAWSVIKNAYTEALGDIGFDVSERMSRENYFRHQILDYVSLKGIFGTGKKLKTPANRSHLKKRAGSTLAINTDYVQAEYEVLAQMHYDMEVARAIKAIDRHYNIEPELKKQADKLRRQAKKAGSDDLKGVPWQDIVEIPEGYVEWRPREGNVFYFAESIPEAMAEKLFEGALDVLLEEGGVKTSKVLAMGGRRKAYIIKSELAETLDKITRERSEGLFALANREILNKWKQWQLISPRRYFKYNIRNLTGDADIVVLGSPSAFLHVPRAVTDLWRSYTKGIMSKDLKSWHDRGGMGSTLQVQEMGELNELAVFMRLKHPEMKWSNIPLSAWKAYWKYARLSTDFRESILRYAAYLDALKEMRSTPDGLPKNYRASIPEEIQGLPTIEERAYFLSNDLLGAYDRIGVFGQSMRELVFPFWSFKEVNLRRYNRIVRNVVQNKNAGILIGRKVAGEFAKTPYRALVAGEWLIRATAFTVACQMWNYLRFPQEEKDLDEQTRTRPHIILGRDENGEVITFTRIGALQDLLETFGLDGVPEYIQKYMQGRMTVKDVAVDMAKQPPNVLVNGSLPFVKLTFEMITRRSLFPSIWDQGVVRDRTLHLFRSFGLENEYLALSGTPSHPYSTSLSKLFVYKTDPYESAYFDIVEAKTKFLTKKGKYGEGFWITPRGDALYKSRLALRYNDEQAAKKWMLAYAEKGGALENWGKSFMNMMPLAGLTQSEQGEFIAEVLKRGDQEKLLKAYKFFNELYTGVDVSRQEMEVKE